MERLCELPAISHFMRDGFISTECLPSPRPPWEYPRAPGYVVVSSSSSGQEWSILSERRVREERMFERFRSLRTLQRRSNRLLDRIDGKIMKFIVCV